MRPTGLIAWVVLVGGCQCSDAHDEDSLPRPSQPASSITTADIKRPERNYFVINTSGRCYVYWASASTRSVGKGLSCPRDIESGEQVRLAGKTCIRESSKPERNIPVRCPKQLF